MKTEKEYCLVYSTKNLESVDYDRFDGVKAERLEEIVQALIEQDNSNFCIRYNSKKELINDAKKLLEEYESHNEDGAYFCKMILDTCH